MGKGSDHSASNNELENRPYPPSWIERLIAWIKRLPGPSWVAYFFLFLATTLINTGAFWLDGSLQLGTLDIARIAEVPPAVVLLPLIHYLNNVAGTALSKFRPILEVTDDQYSSLSYQFTTLPRRLGWLSLVLGLPLAGMSVITDPAAWQLSESSSLLLVIYRGATAIAIMTISSAFFLHTIHQLRMVDRLQRMPASVSLFQTGPVYALSSLTARTGIGIALLVYYLGFINYGLEVFGPKPPLSFVDLTVIGAMLMTSISAFIIPLLGMHDRLVVEKDRALYEANERIELVIARLHEQVDAAKEKGADMVHKNLASLLLEAETLSKMSTWPWSPQTLRGFLGAIALPVLVWFITTALERILHG